VRIDILTIYIYNNILVINYAIVRCHVAARTYLPTIYTVLLFICAYIAKHRDRMLEVVGTDNAELFDALVAACHALTAIIKPYVQPGT